MRALSVLASLFVAAPALAQPAPYRAAGTEPFWSLTLEQRTMRLEEPDRRPLTIAKPVPRPSFNGERYVTRAMTVDVTHAPCSDGMSDRTYRDTVTVQVGRRTLKGCGGDVRGSSGGGEQSRLTGTKWRVWTINGRPVPTAQPLNVNFTADRVEGKLCNNFGAGYSLTGDRLGVSKIVATRMACQGPANTAETVLFALWSRPSKATISRWGTLVIERGRDTVTLRPVRR